MAFAFIEVDKPFYFAGDTVEGRIHLNLITNVTANEVYVKFKGWQSVRWLQERIVPQDRAATISSALIWHNVVFVRMDSSDSEDHPVEDQGMKCKYVRENGYLKQIIRFSGNRNVARFEHILHNFGGSFIPAGQYTFPFSFKTGQNYPASFVDRSTDNKRRGRIKYELQAYIRGFNSILRIVKCKTEIVIRQSTVIKNEHQQIEAQVTSCCCIDQGTTKIQCFFQKNAYSPGEDAKIYCKVDNTLGKTDVLAVSVTLINEITYTSSENIKKTFRNDLLRNKFSGLAPGQKGEREQEVKITNQQSGSNLIDIKPTTRGLRLHSVYFLQVEAELAAACTCCSPLPVVRQPILIYPYIPVDYNFKAPSNWHPQVMPMINLQMDVGALVGKAIISGMQVEMNVPKVEVMIPAPKIKTNVQIKESMTGTSMQMSSNGISSNMHINSPHLGVKVGGNVGMGVTSGVGMSGGVHTGVGVGVGGVGMGVGLGVGVSGGISMGMGMGAGGGGVDVGMRLG